jgi:hypothetical protein
MRPTNSGSETRQLIRDLLVGVLALAGIGAVIALGTHGLELIAMR